MSSDEQAIGVSASRQAGVLLHITSLPGPGVTGDLGAEAFHFVDFLQSCGFSLWQMLPIGPTQSDGSPYQNSSAHAGNPRLIGLEPLVQAGWLDHGWIERDQVSDAEKIEAIESAWTGFLANKTPQQQAAFDNFVESNAYWLEDYALFRVLHEAHQFQCWWHWPKPNSLRPGCTQS